MNKRSIGLVLCLILVLVVCIACGNNTNNANNANNTPAATPEKPAEDVKPAEKTKLSYWTGDRHDADYIKEVVDKYNATNEDNIEVELVIKTEDFNQAIDLSFATSETPDIIRVKENTIQIFHAKDYLAPIDAYLTPELKAKFAEVNEYNSFDGKMYSLPAYGTTLRLVYNKELFAKAGIANPPTTLDEMVDAAKKITEVGKADGAYGFAQNFKSPGSALGRSARVIAEVSGIGGAGYDFKTARYDFAGFEPIINAFKQMYEDGSTLPGMEALDIDPLRAQFAEGKLGMYLSFSSEPGVYKNQFPAKIEWAGAPVPTIDGTIKGAAPLLGGQWLAISSKSPNKDQAWKFMEYMYSQEVLQKHHEGGFGISMVPSVIDVAKAPEINGIDGFIPTKHEGIWPVAPIIAVEGMNFNDAFFKYMITGGDFGAIVKDLNTRYNASLDAAIKNDGIKAEPNPDFDPMKLMGQFGK